MDSQSQDHPLLLELNSLKSAVARFQVTSYTISHFLLLTLLFHVQDEAHTAAVKLQRHSLDGANTHERAIILERENEWLKAEIAILRANPTTSPSNSTVEQVQQLTLSLRRLSEKLTLTEDALSSKTTELAQANADLLKARLAVENAYELGARVRGREEAAKTRENELQWLLKSAEEEKKRSEVAVGEYANLVRSMEARMRLASTSTLVYPHNNTEEEDSEKTYSGDALANSLVEGKLGLKRLLSEFHSDTEELQRQLSQLRGELEVVKSNHEAERKGNHILHLELGKAQAELHLLKINDNTAARMVSRYM
jgi:chromosome segregation ATPase